jgi:opacity protein-like surface antigen
MKKLLILGVLLAMPTLSMAQKMKEGNIELGLGGGYSFSVVSSSNSAMKQSLLISGNFFGSAEYYFSNRWGVKSKLGVDNKGYVAEYTSTMLLGGTTYTKKTLNLSYLTIPIMMNWHFGSTRKWYLNFGLYAGFLMDAKDEKNSKLNETYKSTDFGIAYGIGYKFPVSDDFKINIEYDEQDGFSNIYTNKDLQSLQNSRGSFNLGLIYTLKN